MKIKHSLGSRVFDAFNVLLMVFLSVSILYPFWNLLVQSLNQGYATVNALRFWPEKFTFFNYEHVLSNHYIWSG